MGAMSERDAAGGGAGGKRPLGADLIIPIGAAAFAIYYLYTVWGLSWQAASVGIGISSAMAVLLVILAVRFIGELRRGEADLGLGELVQPVFYLMQRLGILAAVIGFIYVMPYLGFTISLFTFMMVGIIVLSGLRHIKTGLVIASFVSLGGYLLFIVFIRARFPHGPFENLVGQLF
jgi:hypothetical protein